MTGLRRAGILFLAAAFDLVASAGCAGEPRRDDSPPPAAPTASSVARDVIRLQVDQAAQGTYRCCIHPGCMLCPVSLGRCTCAQRLAGGESVCPECAGGWQAGQGRLAGVSPDEVHPMTAEESRDLYEARQRGLSQPLE